MTPPAAVGTATTAHTHQGSGRMQNSWTLFRRQSTYYQLRALLVLVYAGICAATVLWAPWPWSTPNANKLDAFVLVGKDLFMQPYLMVENRSANTWTNLDFVLNDTYVYIEAKPLALAPGNRLQLALPRFKLRQVVPTKHKPRSHIISPTNDTSLARLRIACDQGWADIDLTIATVPR
jgi:hypothetical protein